MVHILPFLLLPLLQLLLCRIPGIPAKGMIGECNSESQNFEEERMWNVFFEGKKNGVFVEMGALDGVKYSNTFCLRTQFDWKGVMVEASPINFAQLQKNIEKEKKIGVKGPITLHHGAVCAPPHHHISFHSDGPVGSEKDADMWKSAYPESVSTVPCKPTSEYLKHEPHIDFYSLDIEGSELLALETLDMVETKIDVFMIEMDGQNLAANYKVRQYLFNVGYVECLHVVDNSGVFIHKSTKYKCPFGSRLKAVADEVKGDGSAKDISEWKRGGSLIRYKEDSYTENDLYGSERYIKYYS